MLYGEELLRHAHGQGLAEAPGAGQQGHIVLVSDKNGIAFPKVFR